MKNLITQAVAVAFTVLALASCNKDEDKVTVSPSDSLTLTSSTNSVVLAQLNDPQTAIAYTWNPVQFALSGTESTTAPAVSYQLQVAKTADGFGYPAIFDAGVNTTRSITVVELNDALNQLGITPQTAVPVYMRVVAVVGADNHTFASSPVALTATAYPACVPPNADTWALVGPAGNGWPGGTAATEDGITLKWNCALNAYTARTTLNAGPFKFRKDKAWTINLGGAGTLTQGVPLTLGGSDLTIATPGTYTVKLVVAGSGTGVTGGNVTVTP